MKEEIWIRRWWWKKSKRAFVCMCKRAMHAYFCEHYFLFPISGYSDIFHFSPLLNFSSLFYDFFLVYFFFSLFIRWILHFTSFVLVVAHWVWMFAMFFCSYARLSQWSFQFFCCRWFCSCCWDWLMNAYSHYLQIYIYTLEHFIRIFISFVKSGRAARLATEHNL